MIISGFVRSSEVIRDEIVVNGPGLTPDKIVMPARYFFIYFRGLDYSGNETVKTEDVKVVISGKTKADLPCRLWSHVLNRKDSSVIVRYKLVGDPCYNVIINIAYKLAVIPGYPIYIKGPVYPDECKCPEEDIDIWLQDYGCDPNDKQIKADLGRFHDVDVSSFYDRAVHRFNNSYSSSVCHYVVKSNEVYRNCYGHHVGFKVFMDKILLSLTRKVVLPDLEFFSNLGDWPLMKLNRPDLFPLFSWCGSKETADIIMPSYDITDSSLECMGTVSLDMLSVQGNIEKTWDEKEDKVFWRGRDSNEARLKLIDISRNYPNLFNSSLTNFFFFKDKEDIYGPKVKHISFFKFFDYKYQLNLDGTVAAFRFPYLLVGDSVVFKQQSDYYEHFYHRVLPWVHYIPVKSDLSDLVEKVQWAKDNEESAKTISKNARKFARNNLLPQHIFCYHVTLFSEWSRLLKSKVVVREDMEHVEDEGRGKKCDCNRREKDEL
ncbi:hypothetical protein GE061_009807 [Apolygus lucorum]|uniref:Glycosyl transferase CAP10 domain-containing protein n=1 Tax=Apolygus lucorum TaxID=248454 RepID=A0A8S9Y3A7_APOLU|nr:hypothetical protein GE061_009807 [Apolygus lucorum]